MDQKMLYDKFRSRSPRDDVNDHFGPRMNMRYRDGPDDSYRKRSPRDDYKSWESNANWSKKSLQHYSQTSNQYAPSDQVSYGSRRSPPRDYRSNTRAWPSSSNEGYMYDPDIHCKYPDNAEKFSPNRNRGRSPFRHRSPFSYSNSQTQMHHSHSRSRSPIFTRRHSRSRSPRYESTAKRSLLAEDLFSSIYSSGDDVPTSVGSHTYSDLKEKQPIEAVDRLQKSYKYEKGESSLRYSRPKNRGYSDEDEAHLYGGDSNFNHYAKEKTISRNKISPREETRSPSNEKQAVTPGGFDTNALKNVLKAIGFDFELSAQSLQKSAITDTIKKNATSERKSLSNVSNHDAKKIQSVVEASSTPATPQVSEQTQAVFQNPFQQGAQALISAASYIPSGVDSNFVYNQGGLQIPTNFAAPQIIYQPGLAQSAVMPIVQSSTAVVNERPNLKVIPTVSITPLEAKEAASVKPTKTLEQEKRERKKRLDYLEVELKNLKKKQTELSRKKKKQFDTMDQKQMRENSAMQAGVEKQIQEIREAAERAAGIRSSSDSSDSDSSSGSSCIAVEAKFKYIDCGNHFCSDCNVSHSSLSEYFDHLHSKNHRKQMDPNYKPWYKKLSLKSNPNAPTKPCKGSQFFVPISGFYCKLCKTYSGDGIAAEEHCQSQSHNLQYANFCKKHPDYEKKKENRDLQLLASRLKKLKEEQKDDKVSKEKNHLPSQYGVDENTRSKEKVRDQGNNEKYYDDRADERLYNDRKLDKYERKTEKYFADRKEEKSYDGRKDRNSYMKQISRSDDKKRDDIYHDKYYRDDISVGSRSSSRAYDVSPSRKDYKSHGDGRPYEKSYSKFDDQRRYRKSPVQTEYHKRSRSPSPLKDQFGPKKSDPSIRYKPRFDKNQNKYPKGSKKGFRKWSPGYDALEKSREESNSEKKLEEKKPSSNFAKFTWKKLDNKRVRKFNANIKNSDDDKPASKTSNAGNRMFRNRARLTNRLANFAPHTQIVHSQKQKSSTQAANLKTTFSAKVKPIQRDPPLKPISEPNQQTQVSVQNSMPLTGTKSFEPPPPGTEDIFVEDDVGNASDGSGISMEIGSDNDP